MPAMWKIGMTVLILCLVASIAIAAVRLATTPTEIIGNGFRGLPQHRHPPHQDAREHQGPR